MSDICGSCGCEGTLVTNESGTICTACGVAVTLPTLETDLQGDRDKNRPVSHTTLSLSPDSLWLCSLKGSQLPLKLHKEQAKTVWSKCMSTLFKAA